MTEYAVETLEVPFARKTDAQRAWWLNWANSHDWGGDPAEYEGDAMTVSSLYRTTTGATYVEYYSAMTPRELRDWAGY